MFDGLNEFKNLMSCAKCVLAISSIHDATCTIFNRHPLIIRIIIIGLQKASSIRKILVNSNTRYTFASTFFGNVFHDNEN